jgi:hypothetical protein
MKQKQIDSAVAKLHLEPGDALVVDARAFIDPQNMHFARAPRDVRIFAVFPTGDQTVEEAFTVLHAAQLEGLTQKKLYEMVRAFGVTGHPLAIIDGIEKDFCNCECLNNDPCSIHERCAALRALLKEPNATD